MQFEILVNSADGDESSRVWGSRYRPRPDQGFEPYVFREAIRRRRKTQRNFQLVSVFMVGQEATGGLRSLLLESLQNQHAAIIGVIRKKGDIRVVLTQCPSPAQAFVAGLFAWERIGVHKEFRTIADGQFTFPEVKFVLEE